MSGKKAARPCPCGWPGHRSACCCTLERVARSIADLAGSDAIEAAHAAEAIGYRRILAGA